MQASSIVIKNKCHLTVALQSLFDFSELLIRLELTDADAPVGLYLHSSQTLFEGLRYIYIPPQTPPLTKVGLVVNLWFTPPTVDNISAEFISLITKEGFRGRQPPVQ